MSAAENPDGSVSMDTDVGPQTPSATQSPTNESPDYDFENVSRGLEGDYDTDIEVIGDIHDTDIESYKTAMESKYGEEGPNGILAVGDLTSVPGKPEVDDIEEYAELYEENLSELESIAESLDTDVYVVDGNNDPAEGAHPGEKLIEQVNEYALEAKEEFSDEDNFKDFVFDDLDNVQDISYDSVDIGDVTVVGGSTHYDPEISEEYRGEVDLEDFDYDLEEVASELEERHESDYGFLGKIPLIGGIVETIGGFLGYGGIDIDPEDIDLEDFEELPDDVLEELGDKEALDQYLEEKEKAEEKYGEKREKLEQLLDDAEENVIVLDHGMPYGGEEDFELDYVNDEAGHQGSLVWRDLLEEYEVDSFFGGHFHGNGGMEGELHETDVYNVAKGQYMEVGVNDGSMEEGYLYDQREWGAEPVSENPDSADQPELTMDERLKINQIVEMEQLGGPDKYWEEIEDQVEGRAEELEVDSKEEFKQSEREQINELWENREEVLEEMGVQIKPQTGAQPQQPASA